MANKRQNPIRTGKSKLIQALVFTALIGYLLYALISQQTLLNEKKEQYAQAEEKLAAAKAENIELQKEYASIGTDEFYEKVAREVFGYVKPGEKIFYESKN